MSDKTGTTLTAEIRAAVDMVGSDFVSDAEILALINTYYAELYDLILAAYGQWYYATEVTFTTTVGTYLYSFAPDIAGPFGRDGLDLYKLLGVSLYVNGEAKALEPCPWGERFKFGTLSSDYGEPSVYRLHALGLSLGPTPDAAYSTVIHYVPRCPTMLAATPLLGINGWEDYVKACVCIMLKSKEDADVSVWMAVKDSFKKRIEAMRPRDVGGVQSVAQTRQIRSRMRGGR